jgi:hypothetical protein
MEYTVISGNFKQVMHTKTADQAALSALSLWASKKVKPNLAKITTVVNPENKEINLLTVALLNQV